jgi:hypothetical protein
MIRRSARLVVVAMLGLTLVAAHAGPATAAADLAVVRDATAPFHRLAAAEDAGYGLFTDLAGIACIDKPGVGTMGVHYVNLAEVLNAEEDAATPEALVYEPTKNGRMRLVAVEYVVFKSLWDAAHPGTVPSLFGEEFELEPTGVNRYGLPPYYSLHVWLWKHNGEDMFADWNEDVTCAHA